MVFNQQSMKFGPHNYKILYAGIYWPLFYFPLHRHRQSVSGRVEF